MLEAKLMLSVAVQYKLKSGTTGKCLENFRMTDFFGFDVGQGILFSVFRPYSKSKSHNNGSIVLH